MRRCGIIILLFLITFTATWMAGAAPTPVSNTKHNLSTSGTGTIKSTGAGTSEICVFCHTPHSAAAIANAPLWNKKLNDTDPAYIVYSSDVLSQLSYPAAEPPLKTGKAIHLRKTRLCLSCHDGTIALGQLANLPSGLSSDVPMAGGVTVMPTASTGYIGIELQDDHPVAIPYTNTDPELLPPPTGSVKTFDDGSGTLYVECTSCHNPHSNEFGNFLVASNSQSGICASCHNKTGFSLSIHDVSSLSYSPPNGTGSGVLGSTVGEVKCMDCHFPHKAGVTAAASTTPNPGAGKYLLSFQEESSCFNNPSDRWGTAGSAGVCHGSTATGNNAIKRNIQSLVDESSGKPYKHRVTDPTKTGRHKATESRDPANGLALYNWTSSGASWHAECQDCHNPHTSGNAGRVVGLNTVAAASSLYGAGGASVAGSYPGWAVKTANYTYIEPIGLLRTSGGNLGVTYEYEICFKCHTDFAWGTTPPNSPSLGQSMTNQAVEFNPSNPSRHPVVQATGRTVGTLRYPWITNQSTQTMYCSDCHAREENTAPMGPHGSTYPFILTYQFSDTLGTASGTSQNSTDLCLGCHEPNTYLNPSLTDTSNTGFKTSGGMNLHASHAYRAVPANPRPNGSGVTSPISYKCANCHIRIPHGGWRRGMVIVRGEGATYGTQYEAGGINAGLIETLSSPGTPGTYGSGMTSNCSTAIGCHRNI